MVGRIEMGGDGRATGVLYHREGVWRRQRARHVVVAGYSVETPRLLLNSACSHFPDGLANGSGWVGKCLMTHSNHVATSAGNVVKWSDEIIKAAQDVRSSTDAKVAAGHVAHLNMLAQQLTSGVDADKNGQIGWQAGEGGLQQADMHVNLLLKGEGQ